jgi:hypothetical protein
MNVEKMYHHNTIDVTNGIPFMMTIAVTMTSTIMYGFIWLMAMTSILTPSSVVI